MTTDATATLPAPASRHALALLRFPDPRTDWIILSVATLAEPIGPDLLAARLAEIHAVVPAVGARLRGETWHPGDPPPIEVCDGDPFDLADLDRAIDLATEPPLRVVLGAGGTRLAMPCHHAAFDGMGMIAILRALLGGELPRPVASPPPGPPGSKIPLVKRLLRPAHPVAPTPGVWPGDSFAAMAVEGGGRGFTGRYAAACAEAVADHNRRRSWPLRRIGITVAVGGPAGVGNVASYRRLDLRVGGPVAEPVHAALRVPDEPGEQVNAPARLMALLVPVVERFSDTILVTNLGRHALDGVDRLEIYAVARGRSAVAFGATTVEGGPTTLTLRARDLSPVDTRRLLLEAATRLDPTAGPHTATATNAASRRRP